MKKIHLINSMTNFRKTQKSEGVKMKTSKKMLALLALNTLTAVSGKAAETKTDRLYKNITKNIQIGKSNSANYKLIESILKEKNKELKDLYLQSDYIIKPEYLEWQVFTSGVYSYKDRGGEKDTVTNKINSEVKSVNLGMVIPVTGMTKSPLSLNITSVDEPDIKVTTQSVTAPQVTGQTVNFSGIEIPSAPNLILVADVNANELSIESIGSNASNVAYYTSGGMIFENLNVNTNNTSLTLDTSTRNIDISGEMSYVNGLYSGVSQSSYTHTGYTDNFAVHNIGLSGNFEIKGNWDMTINDTGSLWRPVGFINYRPYSITGDSMTTFSGDLNLGITSDYDLSNTPLIGMSLNLSSPVSDSYKAVLENTGTITLKDNPTVETIIGMQLDKSSAAYIRNGELINSGHIIVESSTVDPSYPGSYWSGDIGTAGMLVSALPSSSSVLVKPGNITLKGAGANALEIAGDYYSTNVRIDGTDGQLIVEGTQNTALFLGGDLSSTRTSSLENVSNLNIFLNGDTTFALIYGQSSSSNVYLPVVLNDSIISSMEFGENSNQSAIIYNPGVGSTDLILESSLANALGQINSGTLNAIAITNSGTLKNYMPINIGSGATAMKGIVSSNSSTENYADIVNYSRDGIYKRYIYTSDDEGNPITEIEEIPVGGIGLAAPYYDTYYNSYISNHGNIEMGGNYSTAVYNFDDNFVSESDHITANGNMATAIYAGSNSLNQISNTNIKADKLMVKGENGTVLNSNSAHINIGSFTSGQAMELTADGNNTFAFYFKEYVDIWGDAVPYLGKVTLTSNVNANLKNGAIGFYYKGDGTANTADFYSFLDTVVDTSGNNLTVNVDSDSYKIAIDNAKVNLSGLLNSANTSGINFTGTDRSKIYRSKVIIDIDSNLDKNNSVGDKSYSNMEIGNSGIDISSGITVSGTEEGLGGIVQSFAHDDVKIESNNFGTINLSGDKSAGIYNKMGVSKNKGIINISGNSGTGIYAVTGQAENSGEIFIGNKGIGMYAETLLSPAENPTSSSSVSISNSGKITALSGEKAVGIFVNQNALTGTTGTASLDLSDGEINVSASESGIGVYSDGAGISGTNSAITVGENGTGVYVKNAATNLYNLELNLYGDNSVGVYTDGTASFNGSGTVNVDGKGITVFNIAGSGGINQNFTVNSTAGSQYTVQNIKDTIFYYNSAADMGEGGNFLTGTNSAVLLDTNSSLSSSADNMTGIALKGSYAGGLPVTINGETQYYDVVNKGQISFKNNSVGIYTAGGAGIKNDGSISMGDYSAALYGNGTGTRILNNGSVEIGKYSVGIYNNDGAEIINDGNIISSADGVTALYIDGSSNTAGANSKTIKLTGEKSVGVYISENGSKTFENTGTIETGDSNSATPNIGIYNNNNNAVITNSGNITAGKGGVGIYNSGGYINYISGIMNTGESGVGIYSDSGTMNIKNGIINVNGKNTVGLYGINGSAINNNSEINVDSESYGIVLEGTSSLINRNSSTVGDMGVFLYSDGNTSVTNEAGAAVTMNGSESIGFYMENGGTVTNNADITANSGTANIGIYNESGSLYNTGNIKIGDSVITDPENPFSNKYAVGVYGENLANMVNIGNIEIGESSVGFYSTGNINEAVNTGNISSSSSSAIGIYIEQGAVRNSGNIALLGNNSIGIASPRNGQVTNAGIITMNGDNSIGIYANANSTVINESTGKIYINGNNSTGVQLSDGSTLENYGTIIVSSGTIGSTQVIEGKASYTAPSIINAGVIKVDEKFELDGYNLIIKADPSSFRKPTMDEVTANSYELSDANAGFLLSNRVSIVAPSFDFGNNAAQIDPLFTQGTNARVYKFENVFDPSTPGGGTNTGEVTVKSNSLTFDAVPVTNDKGKIDIWMEKINYDNFTAGAWYDGFAKEIESKYLNAEGDALKVYDKLDLITDETVLRNSLEQLAGGMYSNINQREQDIYGILDNALYTLQNSDNNTKENVKINIIGGKGTTKEKTSGVNSYDYDITGVLALREVERTYKHKFGYSLGYTRTDFQIDGTDNEDQADTVQLGLHNKYSSDGWNLKNDFLGRLSFHSADRNLTWYDNTVSSFNSDYQVYGVTLLNEAEKEISVNRNIKLKPYIGLELGYMTHGSFDENGGGEKLSVDSNDGYSVKPNLGIRVEGSREFGAASEWKIKGNLGIGYGYELGEMNNQERAKVNLLENNYHNLAKPSDDKGEMKVQGSVGIDLMEKYGLYITGEYGIGDKEKEEYNIGIGFKMTF